MGKLSRADRATPPPAHAEEILPSPVSAAVSERIQSKLRTHCEIQYALAQAHLSNWLGYLNSKSGQVIAKGEIWKDTDPSGSMVLLARNGRIQLSRDGMYVNEWDSYDAAHAWLKLGLNTLPNPVLPLTQASYRRTVDAIPADGALVKKAIRAQVTANICDTDLWDTLNS